MARVVRALVGMRHLDRRWDTPNSLFGDVAMLGFVLVQALDGAFTYLGITFWGPGIEANPIVSSAVAYAGPGTGLTATKLVAVMCGIALHMRRVHNIVAVLTIVYIAVDILPWMALFLYFAH